MAATGIAAKPATIGPLLIVLATGGCGKQYDVAEVEGAILVRGKPGHHFLIQFIPDAEMGNHGPISLAETDANGRYKLELKEASGGASEPGALVGWHKIVLSDLQLAGSETGRGVPIRVAHQYTLSGSTPLAREVRPGKQTIDILVP